MECPELGRALNQSEHRKEWWGMGGSLKYWNIKQWHTTTYKFYDRWEMKGWLWLGGRNTASCELNLCCRLYPIIVFKSAEYSFGRAFPPFAFGKVMYYSHTTVQHWDCISHNVPWMEWAGHRVVKGGPGNISTWAASDRKPSAHQ